MNNSGLPFTKMSGTGNDFIVIDDMQQKLGIDWPSFASQFCARRKSIGADGVIVLEPCDDADFRFRIFNADGSEAEMCGNGARCAASFAYEKKIAPEQMTFSTMAGIIGARIEDSDIAIEMTKPHSLRPDIELSIDDRDFTVYSVDTGVPHAIVFTGDISAVDVDSIGRAIRFHPEFAPSGTNVDFVQIIDNEHIKVRTYERGVEAETLACGTGSVASAICSCLFGKIEKPPVSVSMPGGDLRIDFIYEGIDVSNAWLIGRVDTVYTGSINRDTMI